MAAAESLEPAAHTLPPEIDTAFYRAEYPDLAKLGDRQLIDHFVRWGADEGRRSSPMATRAEFVAEVTRRETGRVLEIGPGCAPMLTGAKIRYLDVASSDRLGSGAPHIHYVGKVDALPRSFDAALACRSIGHHPDLIAHLQATGRVLIEGGLYYLIVPDARFTPAALVPRASAAAVIEAHRELRQRHTIASLIANREWRLDDDIAARWHGKNSPPPLDLRTQRVSAAIAAYDEPGLDREIEAWHFTPHLFRELMGMLHTLGLSPFAPVRVWATPAGKDEFCAVLAKR